MCWLLRTRYVGVSFETGRQLISRKHKATMASQDTTHVDARRFMTRPPRAYRQLDHIEKQMVEQWHDRSGKAFVHKHGFLLYFDMPIQYIALLFVERAKRGQGIGTLLLSKCAMPCMATVLDNRLWEKLGWEVHTVVPDCIKVAVQGLTTPEHQELFDGEIVCMWLHNKLPMESQAQMTIDAAFACEMKQRILEKAEAMMTMRNKYVAMGKPAQEAMRIVFDTCTPAMTIAAN